MGWFWKTKREKQLEAQLQTARDEASRNWEAKIVAENESSDARKAKEQAQRERAAMEKARDWFKKAAETRKEERNSARKQRDQYQREVNALKVDQREKDALCEEKNELHQQVETLEAEVETCREGAEVAAQEKRSLIADRDGWREDHDKLNTQNGELHRCIKTLQEEKEAQRVALARLRDAEAARPVIEVEVYQSKQGRKATPCKRFIARHGGVVVAVSPPQGTNDDAHARERITLLSQGKWVIVERKEDV